MLTSKCALRHNGVHFFDIRTSKSAPRPRCFVHFHFEMCFAPQRPCTFWTSQLPKVFRRPPVFNTFYFQMCFAPTTPYTFSTSTSKSGPNPGVFNILTSKCASRHNGVHFSTSQLQKVVRTLVFLTFWLRNVLRATTACTFSTSQLPKWSDNGVFCTFWLGNVLRATTACNFSSLIWPAWPPHPPL